MKFKVSFNKYFQPADKIRPLLNISPIFDIVTGRPVKLKDGSRVINGGLAPFTGIAGRGNTHKSSLAHFMSLMPVANNYPTIPLFPYDTEMSVTAARYMQLAAYMDHISGKDLEEEGLLFITDGTKVKGGEWLDKLRELNEDRSKGNGIQMVTTPFAGPDGNHFKVLQYINAQIDSLSMMPIDPIDVMLESNEIGTSGNNTEAMRASGAKGQLLRQLPALTQKYRTNVVVTAHMGDSIQMDPMAKPEKKLAFLKQNAKFKHVPEGFTFLPNNLWLCSGTTPLINRTTKLPEFPAGKEDKEYEVKGNVDLMTIKVQNARGKSGPSGDVFTLVASQAEGILIDLSHFLYLKEHDRFGIDGNDRNYNLTLLPDVSLQRTTVRGKIKADRRLRRALEITTELLMMAEFWPPSYREDWMHVNDLKKKLDEKGYDWDKILSETRRYWVFEECKELNPNLKKQLTTLDLLDIANGVREVPEFKKAA